MPFVLAIYDYSCIQRRQSITTENIKPTELKSVNWWKARYMLPAAFLSIGSILNSLGTDDMRSTYICPHTGGKIVPFLQVSGALLDCVVLISIDDIARRTETNNLTGDSTAPKMVGSVFLVSF